MKLLDEYLHRDRLAPEDIIVDDEDEFSIRLADGQVMGVNRGTYRFWRNRDVEVPELPIEESDV